MSNIADKLASIERDWPKSSRNFYRDQRTAIMDAEREIRRLRLVLRRLLDEVESLDDITLSRSIEPYKASANWDDAIRDAHEILGD